MVAMVEHRLRVAGWTGPKLTQDAKLTLYELSHGVPRNIVKICNLAFEMAFINQTQVTPELIQDSAKSTVYQPLVED